MGGGWGLAGGGGVRAVVSIVTKKQNNRWYRPGTKRWAAFLPAAQGSIPRVMPVWREGAGLKIGGIVEAFFASFSSAVKVDRTILYILCKEAMYDTSINSVVGAVRVWVPWCCGCYLRTVCVLAGFPCPGALLHGGSQV